MGSTDPWLQAGMDPSVKLQWGKRVRGWTCAQSVWGKGAHKGGGGGHVGKGVVPVMGTAGKRVRDEGRISPKTLEIPSQGQDSA